MGICASSSAVDVEEHDHGDHEHHHHHQPAPTSWHAIFTLAPTHSLDRPLGGILLPFTSSSSRSRSASASGVTVAMAAAHQEKWIDREATTLIARLETERASVVGHAFNKILLRFPLLRASLGQVKKAFHSQDPASAHTIPLSAVPAVLERLNAKCGNAEEDCALIFNESAEAKGRLTYKAFLVCFAVGVVLGRITITGSSSSASASASASEGAVPSSPAATPGSESSRTAESLGVSASHDAGSILAHKEGVRRASFTEEQAMKLEGDSESAAAIAAMTARRLHAHEDSSSRAAAGATSFSPSTASVSSARSTSAPVPGLNDPAVVSWSFHLILEAFLQLCHEGVIRKADLHQGMTTLAMLSPSTRTLQHAKKETPIRTHEIEAEEAGSGSGAIRFGGASTAEVEVEAFPVGAGGSSSSSSADPVAAAGRRGSASGSAFRRSSAIDAAASSSSSSSGASAPPRKLIPASALEFLTAERYAELDLNANNEVSFPEWVAAFISWCEADDDDEEDDEDEGAGEEGK